MTDEMTKLRERERRKVKALGEQIGFGNMMHLASAIWDEIQPGGAFAYGPCTGSTVPCDHQGKPGHKCDWCCGSGWVTERVAEAMEDDPDTE